MCELSFILHNEILKIMEAAQKYILDNNPVTDISNYLPQKIVAIYSGEEARLFDDCFGPFYLEFVNNINKLSKTEKAILVFIIIKFV